MRPLIASILAFTTAFAAASADLTAQVGRRMLPVYQLSKALFADNPATMWHRDTLSLSSAQALACTERTDHTATPQQGSGSGVMSLSAQSYMHLDSVSTVWGGASFSVGEYRDVKWCNVLDYQLLEPYVLGDGVGGDLSFRKYVFSGGYSRAMSHHWFLGAKLDYRAEIAWRDVDPRVKTVVSDLHIAIGASRAHGENHLLGFGGELRTYDQNCDLDFYNPINDINTYTLTGLGTYYKRFMGNTNKNSGHSGFGYKAICQCLSLNGYGLQAALAVGSMHVGESLRNFNNITLAYTDTYRVSGTLSYGQRLSRSMRALPVLTVEYSRRVGTENLFGTAAGASYNKIGSRSPYLDKSLSTTLVIPIEANCGNITLTLSPSIEYADNHVSMSTPQRSLYVKCLTPGISANLNAVRGAWIWAFTTECRLRRVLDSACECTDAVESATDPWWSVCSAYEVASADFTYYDVEASVSRALAGVVGCFALRYDHTAFRNKGSAYYVSANFKVIF